MRKILPKVYLPVLVYFVLATGISWVFRLQQPEWLSFLRLPQGGSHHGMSLLVGLGPVLAALLCARIFPSKQRVMSFWGNAKGKAILFLAIPLLTLCYLGVPNKQELNQQLYAIYLGLFWMIYIFGEEYGWRAYLQTVLINKGNVFLRSVIIGIIWYLWHLPFTFLDYGLGKQLFFVLILILGSFLQIKLCEKTESLATAMAIHFSFSVLTNIPIVGNATYPILMMIVAWILLYLCWDRF